MILSRTKKSPRSLRERIDSDRRGLAPRQYDAGFRRIWRTADEVISARPPFCGRCGCPVILERFAMSGFNPQNGRSLEAYVVVCPHFGSEGNPDVGHTAYYAAFCADEA